MTVQGTETPAVRTQSLDFFRDVVFGDADTWGPGVPLLTLPNPEGRRAPSGRLMWDTERWAYGAQGRPNLYGIYSTFDAPARANRFSKREIDVIHCYAVVLDDIGTKIPLERMRGRLRPSIILETSAANYQYVYLFAEPQTPEITKRIYAACVRAEITDRITARIIQPFRVPGSINTKEGRDNWVTTATYTSDAAGNIALYSVDELVSGLQIELGDPERIAEPVTPLAEGQRDDMFEWLRRRSLIMSPQANARGFYDLKCPWEVEHSEGGGEFAGYKPGAPGAFRCMHSHCASRGRAALRAWAITQDPEAARIPDATQALDVSTQTAALRDGLARVLSPETVARAVAETEASRAADPVQVATEQLAEAVASMSDLGDVAAYVAPDPETLEGPEWLMAPAYQRGELSALIAPGGVGKSLMIVGEMLSLVSGKPFLSPRTPLGKYRVAYITAEEKMKEIHLRIGAAMKLHGLTQADIGDRLFVWAPRHAVPIVQKNAAGDFAIVADGVNKLIDFLKQHSIDVLIVDPLASFNKSDESNEAMQLIVEAFRRVADTTHEGKGVAVRIAHHTNKAGDGDVRSARGGTALTDGVRQADALATMTKEEASALNIDPATRRQYVRIVDGKSNHAAVDDDRWLKIERLQVNMRARSVAVAPFTPLAVVAPYATVRAIFDLVAQRGHVPRAAQSPDWFGNTVARMAGETGDRQAVRRVGRRWLTALVRYGVLVEAEQPGARRNGERTSRPTYEAGDMPPEADWTGIL